MADARDEVRPFIVWCAGRSWDRELGTHRQMGQAMRRYADLLWVDPPISPVTPARFTAGAPRRAWPSLTRVDESLVRLTPIALPFHSRKPMRPITAAFLRAQIHWALRRLRRRPLAIVSCSLDDVLGRYGADVLDVLYLTDDFVAGAKLMRLDTRRVEFEERTALRRADRAVVISPLLADRSRSLGFTRPLTTVPNGVDAAAYGDLESVERAGGVDLEFPVAGLVGQLSSRIDISLLESVLDSGCSLLLVGPREPEWEPQRFERLLARDRVRWVGPQPFAKLPAYLKWIDVGITPYCDTEFNRASFPLKTLEYLAAGKPVVSTDLPAVGWLATDLVDVADPRSFGAVTRRIGSQPCDPALVRRRIEFAHENSWERRAAAFAAAIGLATPERCAGA